MHEHIERTVFRNVYFPLWFTSVQFPSFILSGLFYLPVHSGMKWKRTGEDKFQNCLLKFLRQMPRNPIIRSGQRWNEIFWMCASEHDLYDIYSTSTSYQHRHHWPKTKLSILYHDDITSVTAVCAPSVCASRSSRVCLLAFVCVCVSVSARLYTSVCITYKYLWMWVVIVS